MPPVLHVAFLKLMTAGKQNLFASNRGTAIDQGHHVLQLIAKPKRTARLIESRARPNAARQGLVKQPAVEHRIHRRVRRSDLYRAEQIVPMRQDFFKGIVNVTRIRKCFDQGLSFLFRPRFAQHKDEFASFMRRQLDGYLQCGARIESGAIAAGQVHTSQSGRARRHAVATKKLLAITSSAENRFVCATESDAVCELIIERIACKDGSGRRINLRNDVRSGSGALHSKN